MRLRRSDAEIVRETADSPGYAVLQRELLAARDQLLQRLVVPGLSRSETENLRGRIAQIDAVLDLPRNIIEFCRGLSVKDKDPE